LQTVYYVDESDDSDVVTEKQVAGYVPPERPFSPLQMAQVVSSEDSDVVVEHQKKGKKRRLNVSSLGFVFLRPIIEYLDMLDFCAMCYVLHFRLQRIRLIQTPDQSRPIMVGVRWILQPT